MKTLPLRLAPGADLRGALEAQLREHHCQAAFVLGAVGSLSRARLRFAGRQDFETLEGDLEILSLAGSLSVDGAHLHIGVADRDGRVSGGHAGRGCIVRTTAEVLLALLPGWTFTREPDPDTGFDELAVRRSPAGPLP